jgi:hypothetical protein
MFIHVNTKNVNNIYNFEILYRYISCNMKLFSFDKPVNNSLLLISNKILLNYNKLLLNLMDPEDFDLPPDW